MIPTLVFGLMGGGRVNTKKSESTITAHDIQKLIVVYCRVRYNRTRRMNNVSSRMIVRANNIRKSLNGKLILSNVSLSARTGEIIGITGPIGAGKSTLLFILAGILTPDSGTIHLFSAPSSDAIRKKINYASGNNRLSGYASVAENLAIYSLLYGVPFNKDSTLSFLTKFTSNASSILHKKVYRLSSGENALVNLCKAFTNTPQLLLLDEISAHLDPVAVLLVIRLLREHAKKGNTILLISQKPEELRALCTRMIVLSRGTIRYDGPPTDARHIETHY
jgi:ABC-type multidrug transport system ATPase subunit